MYNDLMLINVVVRQMDSMYDRIVVFLFVLKKKNICEIFDWRKYILFYVFLNCNFFYLLDFVGNVF